eukprot:TRINITY_DN1830_c0_g1_i3.p1 TRINITY_DN1830_c0_g1~~TRINITY_DN1830_c0_g1_i3.p1  ORF type:complete len:449 (-),score=63.73 TRINITY_DN1830_c0_g1_i3:1369-2664(-)
MQKQKTNITHLPSELIEEILKHLTLTDFTQMLTINKYLSTFSKSSFIWKSFGIKYFDLDLDFIESTVLGVMYDRVDWERYFYWESSFRDQMRVLEWVDLEFGCADQEGVFPCPKGERISPRCGHTVNIVGDFVYIIGGQVKSTLRYNEIYRYSLKTGVIEQLPCEGMPPVSRHQSCTYGSKIIVFGGYDGIENFNELAVYDTETFCWENLECSGEVPVPRSNHTASIIDDYLYIYGGNYSDHRNEYIILGDIYRLHIPTLKWCNITNKIGGKGPGSRTAHRSIAIGKIMYIFGGGKWRNPDWTHLYNDLHMLDTVNLEWIQPSTRGKVDLCSFTSITKLGNHHLCFYGGQMLSIKSRTSPEVFIYDTLSNTWHSTPYLREKYDCRSLDMAGTVIYKDNILVFGGNSGKPLDKWSVIKTHLIAPRNVANPDV